MGARPDCGPRTFPCVGGILGQKPTGAPGPNGGPILPFGFKNAEPLRGGKGSHSLLVKKPLGNVPCELNKTGIRGGPFRLRKHI